MTAATATTRRLDLLAEQATQGLEPPERAELDDLLRDAPAGKAHAFEWAAAAVELAHTGVTEPMPDGLRQRVRARLHQELALSTFPTAGSGSDLLPFRRHGPARSTSSAGLGWLAAAACLALAVAGWWPDAGEPLVGPPGPVPAAARRASFLQTAPDAVTLGWTKTQDPAAREASGDVVWSASRQAGFLRFTGLEANDPAVSQYQLWIFDKAQDERHPVDGGVFDVGADGEVVVPIHATLRVAEPTLFAVTVEKPGGVVVSSRERIVLVAAVG